MKKHIFSICWVILLIILAAQVHAIVATLGTGRIVLSVDVTPEASAFAESEIIVRNTNPEKVTVKLSLKGDLAKRTTLDKKEFSLDPDQSMNIPFSVEITKPGSYEGSIVAQFSYAEQTKKGSASLAAGITVNAKGDGDFSNVPDYPAGYEDDTTDQTGEDQSQNQSADDTSFFDDPSQDQQPQEKKQHDSDLSGSINAGNVVNEKNTITETTNEPVTTTAQQEPTETTTKIPKENNEPSSATFFLTIAGIVIIVAITLIIILKKI